ncbi:MAG: T9SS type A sorting domain-containing protein, partial [Bacteroidales bacterium]|nr:T9SS type A sorting domain-containing protein [Bacteroidales bacterium]
RESATIMLNGVSGEVTVTVVDMNGRTVGQYSTSSTDRLTLDLSGYARGAYFVRVSGEGVNMVKKLIVK